MSIEQKIAELLEESEKLQAEEVIEENTAEEEAVLDEETSVIEEVEEIIEDEAEDLDEENVVTKNAAPAEPMAKLDAEHDDEEDNEDNKKAAMATNKEVSTSQKKNVANANAVSAETAQKMKEDVAALINGEELSEEFKSKAETIFEAAVVTRVKEEVARLEEEFDVQLTERTQEITEGLVEKVDGYLGLMVEQWIEQNELALESGMKSDILEGFVGGLKNLFEEHYIEIPEERFDVLGEMENKVEELESKLNESVDTSIVLKKELDSMKRKQSIAEAAEGLTDTEVDKFVGLAEELSYEDVESFNTKLRTIRENYFGTGNKVKSADVTSVVTDEPVEEQKVLSESISRYVKALNNTTFS